MISRGKQNNSIRQQFLTNEYLPTSYTLLCVGKATSFWAPPTRFSLHIPVPPFVRRAAQSARSKASGGEESWNHLWVEQPWH